VAIRQAVADFLAAGPLPDEDQSAEAVARAEDLLRRVVAPVTREEAMVLLAGFGPDACYGLAWMLLHLIESAPGAPTALYPADADNPWVQLLRSRVENTAPVVLMPQRAPGYMPAWVPLGQRIAADPDWSRLNHAYGSAEDIPALLTRAASGPGDRAWSELWSRLCHQGGVCSASYAALPDLAAIARAWPAGQRGESLVLAAAIAASRDTPHDVPDTPLVDPAVIAELADLTEEELQAHEPESDQESFACLLQAALGLAGTEPWGTELELISNEECEVGCPECLTGNFIVLGEHGFFSTLDDMYMTNTDSTRVPLLPTAPAELREPAASLHARALAKGYTDLASKLTYLFGRACCADCGTTFRVDEAIDDVARPE
jgi:hypothetical protein